MTRISFDEALESPRRRAILAAVQANPGISFRELARFMGLATGTTRHHLTVLQWAHLIVERSHGATLHFFQAAADDETAWVEVVMRREPALAALHDWLKANPSSSQRQVLSAMTVHGWPRSTTQHRLRRLVDAGLATIHCSGRYHLYNAVGPAPVHAPVEPLEAVLAS